MIQWLRTEAGSTALCGQLGLHGFGMTLNGVKDLRKAGQLPADQMIDSHFADLMADPVAAIRKIYDAAGLCWPEGHADRIAGYLREKPKGKHGKHEYGLEEYGLDAANVDADYIDYYGITREN